MTRTTAEAVQLPFDEAVDFFRQKVNVPSKHWTTIMDEAHARAFAVAGATKKELIDDFRRSVDKAISQGTGFGAFKAEFDNIVKRHGWVHRGHAQWRARVIYESNVSTAYAAGRYAQMTEPATLAAFPYWQYVHTPVQHPRIMHLGWNGLTLKADDPWWDVHYPPKGWGCRCVVSVVSEGGLRRMGKTKPDTAPETKWRDYINKTTGVVTRVPEGVDPGWVGNPGKVWKQGAKAPLKAERVRPIGGVTVPVPPHVRRFRKAETADAAMGAAARAWRDGLPPAERRALERLEDAPAPLLRSALESAEAPETIEIWHAVEDEALRDVALLDAGDDWTPARPVSGSVLRQVVQQKMDPLAFLLRILVPKGTRGAAFLGGDQALALISDSCRLTVAEKRDELVMIVAAPATLTR